MNELSSTEFRKVFHRLREVTAVTVNGHPIGTWEPVSIDNLQRSAPRSAPERYVSGVFDGTPSSAQGRSGAPTAEERRRVDIDLGQSRRREDQEKIQALSGPPSLAETRRMRAAASRAFGQFRPAPKPGKR